MEEKEEQVRSLSDQEQFRREKVQKIRDLGIDPFGHKFERTHLSSDIKKEFAGKTHEELEALAAPVTIAGRIMAIRDMGKVAFLTIQDLGGTIQVYLRKDAVSELEWNVYKLADLGDIVGISGTVMLTRTGEITIKCKQYTHLSKALRPLPEKYHGLNDVEERFRRRYVDLIMNEDARRVALARPRIIRAIQHYMDGQGFIEVETPVLQPILGGAAAKPFITHHNAPTRPRPRQRQP